MIPYIGDFAEDATIIHYFNTFDSNDPSGSVTATNLIDSDIFVYKDGNVADIVTDGASVVIDFDARTGLHKLTIDTSVHADYSVGSDYMVMVNGITVDAGTINAGIFTFSIENRFNPAFNEIGTAGAGLTAVPYNSAWNASINAQVDAAIETYHLHYLLHTTYDPASKPGVADALFNELIENDAGVSRFTANALETGPGGSTTQPLLQATTIAVYTSNTSFTLTAGSSDDDAYNNQMCVIIDATTSEQRAVGLISDYVGSTKTVTLDADPLPSFIFANGDTVNIFAITGSPIALEVDVNGRVDVGSVAGTVQTPGNLASLITTVDTVVDGIQSDLSNGTDGLGAISADIAAVDSKLITAQNDLDTITGTDGVTLATTQGLYAPATASALTTIDGKIDTIDTNVDSILADTGTDGVIIAAAQTVATVTDVTNLHASAATAAALATVDTNIDNLNLGIIYGTSVTGTLSTTVSTTDLTGYADDELIGRIIIWTGGTADGQAAEITDYASTNGTVTYADGITTAPTNNDTFKIV